jgi:glutamate/tyrosine decarboxylase-like PLP-dependent enzyme
MVNHCQQTDIQEILSLWVALKPHRRFVVPATWRQGKNRWQGKALYGRGNLYSITANLNSLLCLIKFYPLYTSYPYLKKIRMNERLKKDLAALDLLLEQVKEQGLSYLNTLNERPTSIKNRISEKNTLPSKGLGTLQTLSEFKQRFEPIMVASGGPRYWGFVTGGATPAAIVGDWLATVYDQNPQSASTGTQGDISAQVELETIQLLLELLNLPKTFSGGFVTGATMSNFSCMAVARQWVGKYQGKDFAKEGITTPIPVLTACPHSSTIKSLALLGIGSTNFRKVKTMDGNREAIDVQDLENKILELGGQPFILISSAGTVNTVDFDDFTALVRLKSKYSFWWHIDAAFGGFAACSPQYQHLLKGWEEADSITIDCHKWMNVPYESAFFLVKEIHMKLQVETFQNSNAPYLGDPLDNFNYLNFLPENSRRLKALPAWFSIRAYGKKGYQDIIEKSVEMARILGNFIAGSQHFELLAPVRLNTVCFTLKGEENQDKVNPFLSLLNGRGKVFMTPTVYHNKKGIRAAFVNWRTEKEDIQLAIREMESCIQEMKLNSPAREMAEKD